LNILQTTIYDIPLVNWLVAAGVLVLSWMVMRILHSILLRRLERGAVHSTTDLDTFVLEEVRSVRWYFILALAIFLASTVLNPPAGMRELVRLLTVTALLLQIAISGQALIGFLINRRMRARLETDPAAATTLSAFNLIARLGLWLVILLLVLDNLPGIQITSLIASLGITGVAVALAVQNILGDLFASLSIALDKPFVIGDFIVIDGFTGTVEHIGLKSTRIRSLEGEQIIFSNSDLLNSRIRNYKRMMRRRVPFIIRVRHSTPPESLSRIPDILREIIREQDHATFDRAHFKEISESALIFEVVYFMETSDYMQYMDVHQGINLAIARRFAAEGIQFAFPTQSVILESAGGVEFPR
jgi:small-conductance mechanosensitive channel